MNINPFEIRGKNRFTQELNKINSVLIGHIEKRQAQLQKTERRQNARIDDLSSRLRIVDWHTQEELGRVLDVSLGGLRMLSEKILPQNKVFSLQIEVRMGDRFSKVTTLEAGATWQKNRLEDRFYEIGFYFTNLSADRDQCLRRIINILKLDVPEEKRLLALRDVISACANNARSKAVVHQ